MMNTNNTYVNKEKKLVRDLKDKVPTSFDYLTKHYSYSMNAIIGKYIKSDVDREDLMQEFWMKVWQKIHKYDDSKSGLYCWMSTMAKNLSIDHLRKHGKYFLTNLEDNLSTIDRKTSTRISEDHIHLFDIYSVLNPSEKKVMQLVYNEGYTQGEAAKQLSIPEGTSKSRVRKSLMKLRKIA